MKIIVILILFLGYILALPTVIIIIGIFLSLVIIAYFNYVVVYVFPTIDANLYRYVDNIDIEKKKPFRHKRLVYWLIFVILVVIINGIVTYFFETPPAGYQPPCFKQNEECWPPIDLPRVFTDLQVTPDSNYDYYSDILIYEATQDDDISIEIDTYYVTELKIYLNDELIDQKDIDPDGKATETVTIHNLKDGENIIKLIGSDQFDFSYTAYEFVYKSNNPNISVFKLYEGSYYDGQKISEMKFLVGNIDSIFKQDPFQYFIPISECYYPGCYDYRVHLDKFKTSVNLSRKYSYEDKFLTESDLEVLKNNLEKMRLIHLK